MLCDLVYIAVPRNLEFSLNWHSRLHPHCFNVIECNVHIWNVDTSANLVFRQVQHVQIFCIGEATIGAIKVLDERVASITNSLRSWLTPALTLLLAYVVLCATDCTALLALEIVVLRRHHSIHLHKLITQRSLEIFECQ